MPVDKFGRNDDRATPVYTGINIVNFDKSLSLACLKEKIIFCT